MITDEQIRELRDRKLYPIYWAGDHSVWDDINTCRVALVDREPYARARCAEILNARASSLDYERDDECGTCLGVGGIRDGETNELRRCLDCNGSGKDCNGSGLSNARAASKAGAK